MRTFIKSWKRIFIANVVALFFAAVSFAAISLSETSSPYIMWQGRNNHLLIEVTLNGSKLTPTEMAAITKAEVNFNGQIVDSTICAGCFDWTTYAAQSKVLVDLGAANFDLTTTDRDKDTIFLLYSSSWTYGLVGGTFYMKVKDEADSGGDIIEPLSVITIVVTSPTSGQALIYDGTNWVNGTDNHTASDMATTTTNFDGIFANGITSDTVQECLDLVDDHNHSGVYEPAGITALDISDKNVGTDITADLEEETHAIEHAVGAADTVFPADPNADKYLMWDDVPGELIWATTTAAPPDADYGDVTVSGGVWEVEDDSHAHTTTTISGLDIGDDTNLAGTANEITLTGDVLSLSAIIDLGGKTSLEIPNAADPTTDASGEIAVDSSAAPGSGIRFYGDAAYTLAGTYSKSFVILNPVATDDYPVWCTPYAITIKRVRVQCLEGINVVGQLTECDGEGINAVVVDSSDITATANTSVDDDGTLSNPSIDANDFIGWKTESVSGTPISVTVTFDYIINSVN